MALSTVTDRLNPGNPDITATLRAMDGDVARARLGRIARERPSVIAELLAECAADPDLRSALDRYWQVLDESTGTVNPHDGRPDERRITAALDDLHAAAADAIRAASPPPAPSVTGRPALRLVREGAR